MNTHITIAGELECTGNGCQVCALEQLKCYDCGHPVHWGEGSDGKCDECYCGHRPEMQLHERPHLIDEDLDA